MNLFGESFWGYDGSRIWFLSYKPRSKQKSYTKLTFPPNKQISYIYISIYDFFELDPGLSSSYSSCGVRAANDNFKYNPSNIAYRITTTLRINILSISSKPVNKIVNYSKLLPPGIATQIYQAIYAGYLTTNRAQFKRKQFPNYYRKLSKIYSNYENYSAMLDEKSKKIFLVI